ncbi:hypothetical protein JCM24511_08141 [Saitozyma sp. JCM 24511]|nr:hypothetical protein JCM24511_08141 [Saitozyma sp. JCM 24511]
MTPAERHVPGSVHRRGTRGAVDRRPLRRPEYTTPLPTVDDTLDGLPWAVSKMPTNEAGGHVRDLPGMISTEVLETNKLMEIGERILSTV